MAPARTSSRREESGAAAEGEHQARRRQVLVDDGEAGEPRAGLRAGAGHQGLERAFLLEHLRHRPSCVRTPRRLVPVGGRREPLDLVEQFRAPVRTRIFGFRTGVAPRIRGSGGGLGGALDRLSPIPTIQDEGVAAAVRDLDRMVHVRLSEL